MNAHDARLLREADRHMNPPVQDYALVPTDEVVEELIVRNEENGKTASHRSLALYHILLDMIGEDALVEELGYTIDEYPGELKELAIDRGVAK